MLPTVPFLTSYNGFEIDVIALGDADCIVLTQWNNSFPHRILIDGGCAKDAAIVQNFLLSRSYTNFWAILCTHLHRDHAGGLIELVEDARFSFTHGWMHNIHRHLSADVIRRAARASEDVSQVVESTTRLAAAFAKRGVTPKEPFAGMAIAAFPDLVVLGPTFDYYRRVIGESTEIKQPAVNPFVPFPLPAPALGGGVPLSGLAGIIAQQARRQALIPPPRVSPGLTPFSPLGGILSASSLEKTPTTQPYNNTSVILGVQFNGKKALLTADAGSDALAYVDSSWHSLTYLGVPHHGSDGNLSQRDAERFCPEFAVISAIGDSSHPSRAIVSGLVKVGAKVASTHEHGNLWFYSGNVPSRADYHLIEFLKGTGAPQPLFRR